MTDLIIAIVVVAGIVAYCLLHSTEGSPPAAHDTVPVPPPTPKPLPSPGPPAVGVDIYHGDAMPAVKGLSFIFLKATQGAGFTDPEFTARWATLKAQGVIRGAYHFLDPKVDGAAQAQHFVNVMGPLDPTDLPPTLDFETDEGAAPALPQRALNFLEEVERLTKRKPMLYSDQSFLSQYCQDPRFAAYPLWLASLGSKISVPKPWSTWTFWQYAWTPLDQDRFNGDLPALKKFIAESKLA